MNQSKDQVSSDDLKEKLPHNPIDLRQTVGTLYIVATPIGNLEDITFRAIRILKEVELIAAEDTRHTSKLLSHYQIRTSLISCHEHNEVARIEELLSRLTRGINIALVSDAGTPSVSDPGYRLVKAAVAKGIQVVPIPGPCAAVAGLSVCGLSTDAFLFVGFPHKKQGRRMAQIDALKEEKATLVFYESPRRIVSFLGELSAALGDRPAVVAREMTKLHEEFLRGSLSQIADLLNERAGVKGECVLFVGWQESDPEYLSGSDIDKYITKVLETEVGSTSKLARKISAELKLPKQDVYDKIVMLRNC